MEVQKMPTDEERREAARRLREYVDIPDDWWADTYSGFYVEKCVFGDVERHRESELFARLADLIEPSGHGCVPGECPLNVCHDNDRIDRDALLALADELEEKAQFARASTKHAVIYAGYAREYESFARRIREACGEVER